ncbi:hypothetical protein EYB25_000507 [Talaromyces marneffei]|uniref:uncharacterized protein n=1 Tax=Talaromyces marneffei TaxID=37727 RepID=UPI0012AA3140|nr:uncharacterized protein EYB26_001849 [Talaromyces marneffei]KAE8555809.1 hypothetical protein EYB25_000507 [Talaromyces marneffei]QGA14196.1 hypothetical protein EYB26_001849 [Talaromyces marneffei]
MVGLLRVLKDIARTPGPWDGASVSFSFSSTTVDELNGSLPIEAVKWEQQELKAELYQSLFAALAEHGDLPPGEPPLSTDPIEPAALPSGYFYSNGSIYSPSIYSDHDDIVEEHTIEEHIIEKPIAEEPRYAKNVTFKDYAHLVENLCGLPMDQASSSISIKDSSIQDISIHETVSIKETTSVKDSISIKDGASAVQSSTAAPRRGLFRFIREKSARAINAVKTAICPRRDKPYDDWPISDATKSTIQPRKASDATASSEETKGSAATVHHWSSKHVKHPIQTTSSSESLSHPQPSFIFVPTNYAPPVISCLPEYGLPHRLFSDLGLQGRQKTAFIAYNDLAREYGFYILCPPEYDPINFQMFIRLRPSRRELVLRKVRSLGTHLRPCSPNRRVQNLRHMRTFANLSLKYYKMDSLKGKDLVTMGRLCGYGSLKLPGDFAPAVMRLPAPIVSLVSYLVTHGPKARNIFEEPGDIVVAARIYDHLANRILVHEDETTATDNITVRRSLNFSSEVFGVHSDDEDFLRGRFHVLAVAWAFKYLLMGIPGGILGAPRLYSTLIDISHQTFPDEANVLERGLNGALPEVSPTKARAISLAILALTNDIQLDFICAIFGLCSFLDHETRTMLDFYRLKNLPPVNRACLLNRKRILLTFTPLLCEETKDITDDDYGCEAFWVMSMMLDYWRVVSHQLRDADV